MSVEIKTQEKIYKDIIGNISNEYEISEGFLTADLAKANSIELAKVYEAIGSLLEKGDVDRLSADELTKYVWQRKGIERTKATHAKARLRLNGVGTIKKGDLFSTKNKILFESVETKAVSGSGIINAVCTEAGAKGMVGANSIVEFPITINGFTSVTNEEQSYDGFEEESDGSLREKYYKALKRGAKSGNKSHYEKWANEITGVGKAKVFPLWNGANTVKVLIIDDNMQPASSDLVKQAQDYIDPKGGDGSAWGTGSGQAPIGAYCTIESAKGKTIDISVDLKLKIGGEDIDELSEDLALRYKTQINQEIERYFQTIAFMENVDYISPARIGAIILNIDGVFDYTDLQINGTSNQSILVGVDEVAVVGNVEVS